jgi:hypothetical protein
MQRIFARAEALAAEAPVGTEHVLQALVEDERGVAGRVIKRFASREEVLSALADTMSTFAGGRHPGPWTSRIVDGPDGQPIVEPDGMLRQYLVDGKGNEILDAQGRRQRPVLNADHTPVLDDDGHLVLEPVPES